MLILALAIGFALGGVTWFAIFPLERRLSVRKASDALLGALSIWLANFPEHARENPIVVLMCSLGVFGLASSVGMSFDGLERLWSTMVKTIGPGATVEKYLLMVGIIQLIITLILTVFLGVIQILPLYQDRFSAKRSAFLELWLQLGQFGDLIKRAINLTQHLDSLRTAAAIEQREAVEIAGFALSTISIPSLLHLPKHEMNSLAQINDAVHRFNSLIKVPDNTASFSNEQMAAYKAKIEGAVEIARKIQIDSDTLLGACTEFKKQYLDS